MLSHDAGGRPTLVYANSAAASLANLDRGHDRDALAALAPADARMIERGCSPTRAVTAILPAHSGERVASDGTRFLDRGCHAVDGGWLPEVAPVRLSCSPGGSPSTTSSRRWRTGTGRSSFGQFRRIIVSRVRPRSRYPPDRCPLDPCRLDRCRRDPQRSALALVLGFAGGEARAATSAGRRLSRTS